MKCLLCSFPFCSGLTPKVSVFKRKDITIEDPDVVMDSEENIRRASNDIRDSWLATYNFYMQDQDIPNISKALFKRKFYQIVQKLTKEEAYQRVPPSASELTAWEDVKLLNNGGKMITYRDWETDRKSTRLNSSHRSLSRMPSSA